MQVKDDEEKSEILNDYFSSVFTTEKMEVTNLKNKLKGIMNGNILNNVLIAVEIVYKKLSSLQIIKAHGDDGIASIVLMEISSEIKQALTIIYIRSMSESKVPDDWKTANVTRIFKKSNKG